MNKLIITIVVIAIVILGIIWFLGQEAPENGLLEEQFTEEEMTEEEAVEEEMAEEETAEVREIIISGTEFAFSPFEITATEGEKIKLVFENAGEFIHDWNLEGENIATKIISAGDTDTVSFTAPKAGSYNFFCSVGNHRAQGMEGTLIVVAS